MTAKEEQFIQDLTEVFKRYGAKFDQERAYYLGDPETLSVRIEGGNTDISFEDIIESTHLPFTRR